VVGQSFYDQAQTANAVPRWRGQRWVGADGSFFNRPATAATRASFSLPTNQHRGAEGVQARCCVRYELRNNLGLARSLTKRQGAVGLLLNARWAATPPDDVWVLARAYADYPAAEFKQVYGWRWGEETFFERFKNIFEVERFSGTSAAALAQDVHGVYAAAQNTAPSPSRGQLRRVGRANSALAHLRANARGGLSRTPSLVPHQADAEPA